MTDEKKQPWWRDTDQLLAVSTIVLAVSTVLLTLATISLDYFAWRQLAQMKSDSHSSDAHFSDQLQRLTASVNAEAMSANATKKLADAATMEAGQAKLAAAAALNSAKASVSLAHTSAGTLRVAAKSEASTQQLADATSQSVKQFEKSMAINQTNFSRDERPWIWTRASIDQSKVYKGELTLNVDIGNSGKSPAFHPVMQVENWYTGDGDVMPAIRRHYTPIESLPAGIDIGIVPQSGALNEWYKETYVFTISPPQLRVAVNLDDVFGVAGRIRYEDLSGNKYKSDFCYYIEATVRYAPCKAVNEMQ